jgi:hypothetical protein
MAVVRTGTNSFVAVLVIAAGIGIAGLQAAEWPKLRASSEATVWNPGPRWPEIPDVKPDRPNPGPLPQWSNLFAAAANDVTGAFGRAKPVPVLFAAGQPRFSPFAFEIGARYWYSFGDTRFDFTNGHPLAGDPTSTLYWYDTQGHSGEIFARLYHAPSGLFVKGLIGGGVLRDGTIDDRDYFVTQIKFSDTTSEITGNNFRYGIVDLGWAFAVPKAGVRYGVFAGYHYWKSKMTASGLVCNADDVGGFFCGPAGSLLIPNDVAVLVYEPTWHALRVGFDARFEFAPGWTVAGEVAFVPYAKLVNNDSHLLRQSMTDLGPAPNIISRSPWAFGAATEVFINYAVTPNLEVGIGGRYWGMITDRGTVQFGPDFATDYDLKRFDQQRYGMLLQVKGRF